MNTSKRLKYFSIIWTFILVGIVSGLTIIGYKYQEIKDYKYLEKEMIKVTKEFVETEKINIKDKTINIKLNQLINFDPSLEDKIIDNCNGKVRLRKIFIFKTYKAIITCDNYNS